ncbi:protein E6-like [Phoenix dactylifera]|uniref:Protein E6-like n=1 Tax=Phoenix dactylifera TaxID=42345 RepID=A0A8B7D2Y6_PHODC|nr:protein E6-like [Phoenix dactylifera]
MAFLLNKLSLVFLLFLASSSLRIHARESRFFMKTTRPEDPKEATRITEETPAVKTEEPRTIPPVRGLSGRGYGLYGHGQEQFTPTTATNYYNNNNYYSNNNARPNANTFPSSFPDAELASESYDNGGYNYGNHFNNANNSPSKFSNEEFNSRSYETKQYNNYVDNKQYGMSDTRFLENGRYFYDVNGERNRNHYGTYPTRGNPEAGVRAGKYGNGVYGNGNASGYNNAMEYQNNQVNQESQEDYVP